MTYQIIYSSVATKPMPSDELEELLDHARTKNGIQGISGALVYADGMFLQILEGEHAKVQALMTSISKDLRHEAVTVLREGEIPAARFSSWGMAYVSATAEQVARWAGIGAAGSEDAGEDPHRTLQFARDILVLLAPQEAPGTAGTAGKHDRPGIA